MSADRPSVAGVETAEAFASHRRVTLADLASVFLYIGVAGFGGGMAIVAMIEDICVRRRRWMSPEEFAHGVAFGQFLGAFAVNTTTFVGYRMAGIAGAVTAVTAFLTPGVALVILLTALYARYSSVPAMQTALHGIGPVVVAVLVSAAYRMGRSSLESARRSSEAAQGGTDGFVGTYWIVPAIVGVAAFALLFFWHVPVIVILTGVAVVGTIRHLAEKRRRVGAMDS